jgi:hypothetical protein
MQELWEQSNWRSVDKWVRQVQMRHSDVSTAEARQFFNDHVQRDQRRPTPANLKEKYTPIFAKQGGAYQFDIWDQKGTKRKKNLKTGKWTIE